MSNVSKFTQTLLMVLFCTTTKFNLAKAVNELSAQAPIEKGASSGEDLSGTPVDRPVQFEYSRRIKWTELFTQIPDTSRKALASTVKPDAAPYWFLVLSTSGLTYHYDQDIYRESMKLGRRWGISNSDRTKTYLEIGGHPVFRAPTDLGSTLYYLGDGWVHIGTALGFLGVGAYTENTKAYNVGMQLIHGMVVSTIFNQAIKRSTGRESPNQATEERGRWRPFPNTKEYNTQTAKYDAVPSGHMMTATLTFTVLRENFKEYDHILFPVEIAWLTALGFGMVNNGVHWVSDYPLGIAMGYIFGKAAAQLGREDRNFPADKPRGRWTPGMSSDGTLTAGYTYDF